MNEIEAKSAMLLDKIAEDLQDKTGLQPAITFIKAISIGGFLCHPRGTKPAKPGVSNVVVYRDTYCTGVVFGPKFKNYIMTHEDDILKALKFLSDRNFKVLTPELASCALLTVDTMTDREIDDLSQEMIRLGMTEHWLPKEGRTIESLYPPLYETAEEREEKRIRREVAALLTATEKASDPTTGWEFDPGSPITWVKCTYPDGRRSVHFFIRRWHEGDDEVRCDCEWQRYHPKTPCKHAIALNHEIERRKNEK